MSGQDAGGTSRLSEALAALREAAHDGPVPLGEIARHMGADGMAAIVLVFALIAVSPASAIPGVTTGVAVAVFVLVGQMVLGRRSPWLPRLIADRRIDGAKLRSGADWLRRPVGWVEGFLRPRLTFLIHRPWSLVPMLLVLATCLVMPFLEIIPTTGSIASAAIALFAAGMLTRDGALVALATAALSVLPLAVWYFWAGA